MLSNIKLDHAGMKEMLQSAEVATAVHDLAEEVATELIGRSHPDAEIVVDDYTTDRAASSVTVKHPSALGYQAKFGMVTRAAAEVGLEVKERD